MVKFDPKQLSKKGPYDIKYTILSEDILNFNLEIKGWSENDLEYVTTRAAVEDYLNSINSVTFCNNKKHTPSLSQQQKPYKEKKDSLINIIEKIVKDNDWMSDTAPYKAYKVLRDQLDGVNLNAHIHDCGEHKIVQPSKQHSCSYCSLSAQQIYHQLDDLYQQLRSGKINKAAAVKKAQGLNTCYQNSFKRKKDSAYSEKISKFYSRIINY